MGVPKPGVQEHHPSRAAPVLLCPVGLPDLEELRITFSANL